MKIVLSIGVGQIHFGDAIRYLRGIADELRVVRANWLAVWISRLSTVMSRFGIRNGEKARRFSWTLCGRFARHHIRHADILHVRSGAGQGGAIREARKFGVKVLVDHSALHPEQAEQNLKDECSKWGLPLPIAPSVGVWQNVIADCADADILMVNANQIKDSFVARGYDPLKIRVVYLGVRDDFRNVHLDWVGNGGQNDDPIILFTGNFSILKGAEYILESLRILKERDVKVHYDVVGAMNVPNVVVNKYSKSILGSITFHGAKPQDGLKDFLVHSDIFLFPSLADGCAQSGMEALTAGLPVVTTRQSGLPVIDGETGCVVPMKDAAAIADKIEWLLSHPGECERLGKNAAKMMCENYTWQHYAEKVKEIYEELGK